MGKSKIDFRHLLIESILIVFTVLLALALSEWRAGIKENKTRASVLNNIILEVKKNKNDLESKMDYHLEMSKKLGLYLNSDSLWSSLNYNSGIEAMMQIMDKGLQNPDLQSGAWRSAELSGIVNSFDYETIYILSNVYRVQSEGPDNTWKQLASLFGDPNSYDKNSARRLGLMLQVGFNELYSQERSLVYSYENALNALEKTSK
jgi:hypothetical protein